MASYNRVIIMGNLTRDPDYKQLTSGQSVCRLGLASNRQFKNKQTGTMVQEVCFVDIDVWGAQGDSCNQYLKKGSGVLVEGRLKLDTWQDNEGQKRSKHSIVADRVTFLPASTAVQKSDDEFSFGQDEQVQEKKEEARVQPQQPVEQSQVVAQSAPQAEQQVQQAAPQQASTGEVEFKDQKPFEDDLPF